MMLICAEMYRDGGDDEISIVFKLMLMQRYRDMERCAEMVVMKKIQLFQLYGYEYGDEYGEIWRDVERWW